MDTKKSLIILGSIAAAGAALYFILKPNSAKAATPASKKKTGGGVSTASAAKTKDCVVRTYNCQTSTYETIQIPLDANCNNYQPAMPQCAPPPPMGGGDRFKTVPEYLDNGAYYAGYSYYTPSGGLPYSDRRVVKNTGYYSSPEYIGLGAGGPPRGRGDYRAYQMVVRDSPYDVMMYNRRLAYV